jgi:hypothetical protein
MPSSWLFPPNTQDVQLDEKWSFVGKKEKHCDPENPADRLRGDNWDHIALDSEHRLVLAVVNGKRGHFNVRAVLDTVNSALGGRVPRLYTSDEFDAYYSELLLKYGHWVQPGQQGSRGPRPRLEPREELLYATVHKTRENGTVVKVEPRLQFGTPERLVAALAASKSSDEVNTSFLERQNGTDRNQNKRKTRKTYCFSKNWEIHNAMTKFTMYSYNFCWPVRTLRVKLEDGRYREMTPAMSAGLADHVWSMAEWASYPVP